MALFWNLRLGLPVLLVSRVFSQIAAQKSFSEFSGNHSALILLLEYPGKNGWCSGRQLKGAGPGPAFFVRHALACGCPPPLCYSVIYDQTVLLEQSDGRPSHSKRGLKSEITGLSSTLCSPLFSLNKLERSTDSPSRTIALLRCS